MSEDPLFIVKIENFVDLKDRRIKQRLPVSGTPPDNFCEYVGLGVLHFKSATTGNVEREIVEFPIMEVKTLVEAYEKYDSLFEGIVKERIEARKATVKQTALNDLKKHREAKKLILPG